MVQVSSKRFRLESPSAAFKRHPLSFLETLVKKLSERTDFLRLCDVSETYL